MSDQDLDYRDPEHENCRNVEAQLLVQLVEARVAIKVALQERDAAETQCADAERHANEWAMWVERAEAESARLCARMARMETALRRAQPFLHPQSDVYLSVEAALAAEETPQRGAGEETVR